MKFDIIGKRYWAFLISGILVLISVIALATVGLKPGIEFSSGSMLTVMFAEEVSYDDVRAEITALGHTDAIVQETLSDVEKKQITAGLETVFGETSESSFISVDPKAASETTRNAIIAVLVASVGILLYITWAFRRMPNPFRYGTCAVIALIHDAIVALGIFSILGALLDWETNLMFITGLLAVIGYSVNNMVVIFDRIRENTIKGIHPEFDVTVNGSLIETLSRSMNTSLTTIITVLAILIFVGSTIQNFAIVLLIGIVAGTFDSIFVAPALLVVWDKGEWYRFLPWKRAKKA